MNSVLLKAVSKRYALAIYSMAKKSKSVPKQLEELQLVSQALADSPELFTVLQSPTVAAQIKKKVLGEIFGKRVSETTLHFLYVLVDKKREVYFNSIMECYEDLQRAENGVVQCEVRSPKPLLKKSQSALTKKLEKHLNKKVELLPVVDDSMLAGMVVTLGDRVIDASLDTQLAQIQERLAKVGFN